MDLDEELDTMEDGAETEAEQTDEETELQDLEDFEDEGLGVDAEETDLEDAYEEFYYSEEGPEGEGESSDAGDGGLATMDAGETAELGGMGFHLVDEEEARATEDLVDEASGEEGVIRDYDGFAASEEDEELADDLANLADDDEGIEALDGIDDAAYQGFDDEDAAGANDGANDGVDAVPADAAGEDGEEDEEYEEVELEFSEEDIVCYLVDEDDNGDRLHAARRGRQRSRVLLRGRGRGRRRRKGPNPLRPRHHQGRRGPGHQRHERHLQGRRRRGRRAEGGVRRHQERL